MRYLKTYEKFDKIPGIIKTTGNEDAWKVIFGDKLDKYYNVFNSSLIKVESKKYGNFLLTLTITNENKEFKDKYDKIFEEIYEDVKDIPNSELIILKNMNETRRLHFSIAFDSYNFQKYIIENYPDRIYDLFNLQLYYSDKKSK